MWYVRGSKIVATAMTVMCYTEAMTPKIVRKMRYKMVSSVTGIRFDGMWDIWDEANAMRMEPEMQNNKYQWVIMADEVYEMTVIGL